MFMHCTEHFNCHNYSGRVGKFDKKVTLHKLPKEQYTRRAWIRAVSRKNWKPTSYTRVCSDHFRDGIGPNSVDRNKIPTEYLPQRGIITHQNKRQPRTRLENVDSPIDALQHHSYVLNKENIMPESSANIARFSQTMQTCDQPDVLDSSLYHVSTSTSASSCNKST